MSRRILFKIEAEEHSGETAGIIIADGCHDEKDRRILQEFIKLFTSMAEPFDKCGSAVAISKGVIENLLENITPEQYAELCREYLKSKKKDADGREKNPEAAPGDSANITIPLKTSDLKS